MDEQFTRRLRGVRRLGTRGRVFIVTAVILIAVTVYLIGFSPVLVIKDVVVTGATDNVAQTAARNADAPIGRPLARVDTSALAQRVAADTRIKEVNVSRGWPSRVEIEVMMRTPVAVLQRGPRRHVVDAQGTAYDEVAKAPAGLPKVSAPVGEVSPSSLRGALAARDSIANPWVQQMSSLFITADGDIRFRVGVIRVHWGPPTAAKAKAAALTALLAQKPIDPMAEGPMTIDLTAPATPVVTGLPTVP